MVLRQLQAAGTIFAPAEYGAALAEQLPTLTEYAQQVVRERSGFTGELPSTKARVISVSEAVAPMIDRKIEVARRLNTRRHGFRGGTGTAEYLGEMAGHEYLRAPASAWYYKGETTYIAEAIAQSGDPARTFLELALHEELHRAQHAARDAYARASSMRMRAARTLIPRSQQLQLYLTEGHPTSFAHEEGSKPHWLPSLPILTWNARMPTSGADPTRLLPYREGPPWIAQFRAAAALVPSVKALSADIVVAATAADVPVRRADISDPIRYVHKVVRWT